MNTFQQISSSFEDALNIGKLITEGGLSSDFVSHLRKIKEAWNFYEGYHWEGMSDENQSQVTYNYCRAFVNKFVAFELGRGFLINTPVELDRTEVTVGDTKLEISQDENSDGVVSVEEGKTLNYTTKEKTLNEYLTSVWKNNKKDTILTEIGQTKSITGEAWIRVAFESGEDLFDPFQEFPNGRIKISCVPTQYIFPTFNDHDKDQLDSLTVMYPVKSKNQEKGLLGLKKGKGTVLYKEIWTSQEIVVMEGNFEVDRMENPYGFIPFVQIKNFPVAGRTRGFGDLDDIIPLNIEYNIKNSDVSEIIDYHSAPITLVYGARIGNLEKGANKVWGGLPKDSRVENLELRGDLGASGHYIANVKTSMCEIAGVPENVLGGASSISNTSGVALHYMNLPLIERTNIKRASTRYGLELINKMIIFISLTHDLVKKPENITMKDFLSNQVILTDTLPKDELVELQKIEQEMRLGLESRAGAMERLNKDNISQRISEIDNERARTPEIFNKDLQERWYEGKFMTTTNAGGFLNGQTPIEAVRKEITGQNGGGDII